MGIIYDTLIKMNEDPVGYAVPKTNATDPVANPPAVAGPSDTPQDATKPRAYINGTIGKGSPADQIKGLQKQLSIPESGVWDATTDQAVRAKQKEIGATPDGKWGPDSRSKFAAKNPPMPPKKPDELNGMTDKGAGNQAQTGGNAYTPPKEGDRLDAKEIPWETGDGGKWKNYSGRGLVFKNGTWETTDGMGARVDPKAYPEWAKEVDNAYRRQKGMVQQGTGNQPTAIPKAGPNGEPLVKFKNSRGTEQVGYWQRTSGKGTQNFVPVPGGVVQESGYSQDPVLARIVELARK